MAENSRFVPVLTVLAEPGPAYIWVVRSPDEGGVGGNMCSLMGWDDSFPMSHGLWQKFDDWAWEFDQVLSEGGYFQMPDDWDWLAFHARGLQLSRWLKDEVGSAYRVVYLKYGSDPNRSLSERTEVLADGSLLPLLPFLGPFPEPARFCRHIVSGGQTGADRAALDFAIENGYTHGGWAPAGRQAEDGTIPLKYQLTVLPEGGYLERTRRNVEDSDGTLVVNLGELDGETLVAQQFAEALGKPHLVIQLSGEITAEAANDVLVWLRHHEIKTLNIAGPRDSKRPGAYGLTVELLAAMHRSSS